MNIATAFRICMFRKYATFSGTASRSEFWCFFLATTLINIATAILADRVHPIFCLINLAVLVPFLAAVSRRLHDTGHSGWWQLLYLLTYPGIIILVATFFIRKSNPRSVYAATSPSTSWSAYGGNDSSSVHPDGGAASWQSGSGAAGYGSQPFQESPSPSGAAGLPGRTPEQTGIPSLPAASFRAPWTLTPSLVPSAIRWRS